VFGEALDSMKKHCTALMCRYRCQVITIHDLYMINEHSELTVIAVPPTYFLSRSSSPSSSPTLIMYHLLVFPPRVFRAVDCKHMALTPSPFLRASYPLTFFIHHNLRWCVLKRRRMAHLVLNFLTFIISRIRRHFFIHHIRRWCFLERTKRAHMT
jgi:hypothetical protein